jgi:hypothetical protein
MRDVQLGRQLFDIDIGHPVYLAVIANRIGGLQMNRKGVEFTLMQVGPGVWKWQFQIGETVTTGKTQSNLMGIAARRVQQRIDRELGKARDLAS